MQVILLVVSDGGEPWLKDIIQLYTKKINAFTKFSLHIIKPPKKSRQQAIQKKKEEAQKILAFLNNSDKVILFDECGKNLDSLEFSKSFQKVIEQSPQRIVFIIGGAFGVADEIKNRAYQTLSLSKLVYNHHVALIVALEQIYRSYTIQKNLPYHNR